MFRLIMQDLCRKAEWYGLAPTAKSLLRMGFTEGTTAQILYRMMQFCQTHRLKLIAAVLYRLNAHIGHAVIGRGANLGPGLVILHSMGIVINTRVRAGKNLIIEHGVTIGAEKEQVPVIGDNVFIGAQATIIGDVRVGSNVKIAANTLVIKDVPDGATVIGVPARVIRIDTNDGALRPVPVERPLGVFAS